MGKQGKKRKSRKTFNYEIDRRRAWKKSKKMPAIHCKQVKEAWDKRKTTARNMRDMGLTADPNKTFRIPKTKELIGPQAGEVKVVKQKKPRKVDKKFVAEALEEEASHAARRTVKLSEPDHLFCVYMLDKYGTDYKAMAKDYKNYYQDTPKQIKRKISLFRNTPHQYEAYLKSKAGEGT